MRYFNRPSVANQIRSNNGEVIGSLKNALDIHNADVHNIIINKYLHQHTAITTTLTAASAANAYQIQIADATGFTVGDYLHINTTTVETTHPILLATTAATGPATFTLDRRLDYPHDIGDTVLVSIVDMASQIGTLAAPQEYFFGPQPGEVWHITRIIFEMTHSSAGDLGTFGDLAPLTNGVLIRSRVNGQYGTLTNWKTNATIKADMYDLEFDARAGGGGTWGTTGRGSFYRTGAVLRLDGDTTDRLELYVQDDLTGLLSFTMKAQGHPEDA